MNKSSLPATEFFLYSENQDKDIINFHHIPSDCGSESDAVYACYYALGVYGTDSSEKSRYRLNIKRNATHIPLRETESDYNFVRDGETKYYVFDIPRD